MPRVALALRQTDRAIRTGREHIATMPVVLAQIGMRPWGILEVTGHALMQPRCQRSNRIPVADCSSASISESGASVSHPVDLTLYQDCS